VLIFLAQGAASAQGVAFAGDIEAASPEADGGGPSLPSLRDVSTPRPLGGMRQLVHRPSSQRPTPQSVPREMLAAGQAIETTAEPSTGLRSKLGRFSFSGIFGGDTADEPAPSPPPMIHAGPRRMQRRTAPAPSAGEMPQQASARTMPQAPARMVPREPAEEPADTAEKPSRFSIRKLFGGGEEPATEADQGTPASETFERQPRPKSESFRADLQLQRQMQMRRGIELQENEPQQAAGTPTKFATRGNVGFSPRSNNPQPTQMQREMAQAAWPHQNAPEEDDVTPTGYATRNNGLQLRPANNRPASLFGGNPNPTAQSTPRGANMTASRDSYARGAQPQRNNAFSRGQETMQRLAQNHQPPASGSSQPVYVSDDPSFAAAAEASEAQSQDQPLIRSMSPEMPQPAASPPSRIAVSEPSPLVIENRTAMTPQPQTPAVKNPVPPRPEASRPVPAAQPSERVVQLLSEANSFSQTAETEEELTQVVQMCRHALAIDNSQQAVDYSKSLAGWALNRRGELRADAGRDRDAMLDFEDAIHTDPSRWRAVHNRGVLLAQQGQFAAAFDDFNRTLELNPKFAKAYSNRAALYTQAGDLAAALDDYRQAITFDPDLAVAHKGRGRVCHMVGNFEESLQHYDAAALLAPSDGHIALGRADLLTDMGRYAAAIDGYQQTIAIDPSHAAAYRSLAWVQATCPDESFRNAEQAVANAEMAMQLAGQEDDVTLDTLAAAQANAGNFAAAQATQARAIQLTNAEDRSLYEERLSLYQSNQPFRLDSPQPIRQATYRR
jgi:tetratricopeptide (TPR) repeat protein